MIRISPGGYDHLCVASLIFQTKQDEKYPRQRCSLLLGAIRLIRAHLKHPF
jgi:hypothetical protein